MNSINQKTLEFIAFEGHVSHTWEKQHTNVSLDKDFQFSKRATLTVKRNFHLFTTF